MATPPVRLPLNASIRSHRERGLLVGSQALAHNLDDLLISVLAHHLMGAQSPETRVVSDLWRAWLHDDAGHLCTFSLQGLQQILAFRIRQISVYQHEIEHLRVH